MTRGVVVLVLLVAGLATRPGAADRQEQAVFRAAADAVSVHVAVRDGNRPVGGLTAQEFILTDNGVRQIVESVTVGTLPVDVTAVLDTSGSVSGATIQQFKRDVEAAGSLLAAEDRLRILAYASSVVEVRPLSPAHAPSPPIAVKPGGATAFFNAIIAALARQTEPGRPHLVVVFGDGGDNVSLLDDEDVLEVARRSDSVLRVVIRPASSMGWASGWLPFSGANLDRIRSAAEATGGRLDVLGNSRPAAELLGPAIAEFKTGYVLWFRPSATQPGWHDLAVRLRTGRHTVTARRGYFAGR
jgi:VWFA-related protein